MLPPQLNKIYLPLLQPPAARPKNLCCDLGLLIGRRKKNRGRMDGTLNLQAKTIYPIVSAEWWHTLG
jgi:hypothetical protein